MNEQLKYKLKNNKIVQQLISWGNKIVLPGFEGMTLYETLKFIFESFSKAQYGIRSSAISFKFFLALFPGIIFFLSLIPFIPIENFQTNLMAELGATLPSEIFALVESTFNDLIHHKHHAILSFGLLLSLYFASNGINTMLRAFNFSHQLELKKNPIKRRVISLGIFGIMTLFFIIAFTAEIYGEVLVYQREYAKLGWAVRFGYQVVKWLIILFSLTIAISTLYNFGNTQRKKWKIISAGASLATVTIVIASYGLIFFFSNFGKYNELYGSIGSLLMVLIWMNVVSYILLIGFELSTRTNFTK